MYALYFMIWWLSGIYMSLKIMQAAVGNKQLSRESIAFSVLMGLFGLLNLPVYCTKKAKFWRPQ